MSKILMVGPAHPLRGGIAALNERLALALQEQGHEVDILSFSLQYPGFLFPGTSQFTTDPAPQGLRIFTRLNSVNPFNWLANGLRYRSQGYDLAVFRFWLPFMGPCLGTVARLLKPRSGHLLAITDNVVPHEHRPGDELLTRYFLSACTGALAMSQAVMDDLARLAPALPRVYAPHPLYDIYGPHIDKQSARAQLGLEPSGKYLLFFGLIRAYKGLDLLLEALAQPEMATQGIKLIVAGEYYEPPEKYQALIDKLGLADRLVLATHFIPNDEVGRYFAAADLVVQPYRTATQSGISQIAYYFNKPMVVTNVGGLAEIVPHGKAGYVVEVQPQAIAGAIADFYQHGREAAMQAEVAKEKMRYTWPSFVEQLLSLTKNPSSR